MTALGWTLAGFGIVFIWAGIKNENALQVTLDTISGKRQIHKAVVAGAGSGSTKAPIKVPAKVLAPGLLSTGQNVTPT